MENLKAVGKLSPTLVSNLLFRGFLEKRPAERNEGRGNRERQEEKGLKQGVCFGLGEVFSVPQGCNFIFGVWGVFTCYVLVLGRWGV